MMFTIFPEKLQGRGVQGVAIGLKEEYRGMGLGKRLINYPYEHLHCDYIWGLHLKVLLKFPYAAQPDGYSCGCAVIRMVMDKLDLHPESSIPASTEV